MRQILCFLLVLATLAGLPVCRAEGMPEKLGSLELEYAEQFSVDYYSGGYKLISLSDGSQFLVIPEGAAMPDGFDAIPLYQPIQNIYLAATSAMCLFDSLEALDAIRLSGTKEDGWYIPNARTAMADGKILFAGKYSEPDFELLLDQSCGLAVESTMIGHASSVKEQLELLGIPVLVDQSSREKHPLGRTEWVKLYGALLNLEDRAETLFERQTAYLRRALAAEPTGKTAAFFYISSSGRVVARKSDDYVSKMITLAGGEYIFDHLGDGENALSTVTIEMETFFAAAKDADYILYNSTIGGELHTLDELLAKNELLAEFQAVQNGNVWCTGKNMYQETMELGQMTDSFRMVFSGEADALDEIPFLYRLR